MLIDKYFIYGLIDVYLPNKSFIIQKLSNNPSEIHLLAFVNDLVDQQRVALQPLSDIDLQTG